MKNHLKIAAGIFMLFATLSAITSCDKDEDEGLLPTINFKTAGGYTSKDTTVGKGVTLLTGINAAKAEKEDVLKTFYVSRSVNGATAISVKSEQLSGTNGDNYSADYTIVTGSVTGTEVYIYSVTNRDGLIGKISLTVTVQ